MEKVVSDLIEEICLAYEKNDTKLVRKMLYITCFFFNFIFHRFQALEKAEEAMRNEKSLNRYREEQNLPEADISLAGFVCIFNQTKTNSY